MVVRLAMTEATEPRTINVTALAAAAERHTTAVASRKVRARLAIAKMVRAVFPTTPMMVRLAMTEATEPRTTNAMGREVVAGHLIIVMGSRRVRARLVIAKMA